MNTLHGEHCWEGPNLVCGWPDQHPCSEPDCKRTQRPNWTLCDDHAQERIDRAVGVTEPEQQAELPRWEPAA